MPKEPDLGYRVQATEQDRLVLRSTSGFRIALPISLWFSVPSYIPLGWPVLRFLKLNH